jgi:MipA family protein
MKFIAGLISSCLMPTLAMAQTATPDTPVSNSSIPSDSELLTRDTISIAVGGIVTPRYEGSRDYRIIAAGALRGRVKGIGFTTVGTALFIDLIPPVASGTKLVLGPVASFTLNRSNRRTVRDPQIVALGRRRVAVELGGHIGVSRTGVITSAYDTVSLDLAVTYDVARSYSSYIVTPSINYGTPLSRKAFVGLSVAAEYVGAGFARSYFGVTPAQAVASGLAPYTPGAGFKNVGITAIGTRSITGDLRRGLSAFGTVNYSRLLGSIAQSPVVRARGQFFGGVGLAYTF